MFKIIDKSYQFSQYNSFKTNLIFFRVFNPINKIGGSRFYSKFKKRILYIKLLFFYKSQIKIWFGLYPFVIYHYLFKGFNYLEKLNRDKFIKKPHKKKLLYEIRKYLSFEKFQSKTKYFLNDWNLLKKIYYFLILFIIFFNASALIIVFIFFSIIFICIILK